MYQKQREPISEVRANCLLSPASCHRVIFNSFTTLAITFPWPLPPITRILHVTPSHLSRHLPGGKQFHWPELKFKQLENLCCFRIKWKLRHDLIATRDGEIIFCYVARIRRRVFVKGNGKQYRATGRFVHFIASVSVLICVSLFSSLFSFWLLSSLSFSFVFVSLWPVGSDNWKPTPLIKV